jgi:hypothetical protein
MRETGSLLYYATRLEEERALAIAATSPAVRAIHAELAAEYEALALGNSERGSDHQGGTPEAHAPRAENRP